MDPIGPGADVPPEDLTARARIRDAAMQHFAKQGFARATIRGIAETAGVSSGLVRHHFGSKEALRDACDQYVLEAVRKANEEALAQVGAGDAGRTAGSRAAMRPFQPYIARALTDGSRTMAMLFDEILDLSLPWIIAADAGRDDQPTDPRARAALTTAMALGIPMLAEHVSRAMGIDITSVEGDRQMALALIDLYSRPWMSAELAASARAALERLGPPRSATAAEPPCDHPDGSIDE